jgi:hypothetical protein
MRKRKRDHGTSTEHGEPSRFAVASLTADISCLLPLGVAIDSSVVKQLLAQYNRSALIRLDNLPSAALSPSTSTTSATGNSCSSSSGGSYQSLGAVHVLSSAVFKRDCIVGLLVLEASGNRWLLRQYGTQCFAVVSLLSGIMHREVWYERSLTGDGASGIWSIPVVAVEWSFMRHVSAHAANIGIIEVSHMLPLASRVAKPVHSPATIKHTDHTIRSSYLAVTGIVSAVSAVIKGSHFLLAVSQPVALQSQVALHNHCTISILFQHQAVKWRPMLRVGLRITATHIHHSVADSDALPMFKASPSTVVQLHTHRKPPAISNYNTAATITTTTTTTTMTTTTSTVPLEPMHVISYEGQIVASLGNLVYQIDDLLLLVVYHAFSSNCCPASLRPGAIVRVSNAHPVYANDPAHRIVVCSTPILIDCSTIGLL